MKIPEELEIRGVEWPDPHELASEVLKYSTALQHDELEGSLPSEFVVSRPFVKAVLAVATNAWRIRTKLLDSISGELREDLAKEDFRKVNRYADAILEALTNIGLEVKDRTGETFDYGMPEKVIAAQPQEGLNREQVIETIRPSVYWGNQIVQHGEVIIATPPGRSEGEEGECL
jgi:hypothetical protein